MIVKNITGRTTTFGFSNKVTVVLENNATASIPDDPDIVEDAIAKANAGHIEITSGPASSHIVSSGTAPNVILITLATANAADEDTITLDGIVLEIDDDDALANADAIAVELGGSAAATGTNILAAVNASAELAAKGIVGVASGVADAAGNVQIVLTYTGTGFSALTVAEAGTTLTIAKITSAASTTRRRFFVERTLANTTTDLIFVTDLETVTSVRAQVQTATTGVFKSFDGNIRAVGNVVFLDNSGDADVAATDKIILEVLGK